MLTKLMWESINDYDLVETHSLWNYYEEITPGEKALMTIIYTLLTPFVLCIDILLIPLEIIYKLLKKRAEKQLKKNK